MGKGIKYGRFFSCERGGVGSVCVRVYVCVCVCVWVYISSRELPEATLSVGLIPLQVFFYILCIRRLEAFSSRVFQVYLFAFLVYLASLRYRCRAVRYVCRSLIGHFSTSVIIKGKEKLDNSGGKKSLKNVRLRRALN